MVSTSTINSILQGSFTPHSEQHSCSLSVAMRRVPAYSACNLAGHYISTAVGVRASIPSAPNPGSKRAIDLSVGGCGRASAKCGFFWMVSLGGWYAEDRLDGRDPRLMSVAGGLHGLALGSPPLGARLFIASGHPDLGLGGWLLGLDDP